MAVAPSTAVGCSYSILGLLWPQLRTLSHGPVALAPSTAVGCYSLLCVFSATVTHSEHCASGHGAFDGGRLFQPPGVVYLATVTHFEPGASGPDAFDGGHAHLQPGAGGWGGSRQ